MPEEDLLELKFRLLEGSDIGPFRYSLASTIAMLKESIVAEWPKDKKGGPKSASDIKLINAGKILENNKTVVQCRTPFGELSKGVITMHAFVQMSLTKAKNRRHWVLAVLDMETTTCYYLDSLDVSQLFVNSHLKRIIETAMVLHSTQIGSGCKRVKLNWINVMCPRQPGITECGYYVLRFMKEVIEGGVKVLKNDEIGSGKSEYTDVEIDDVREE